MATHHHRMSGSPAAPIINLRSDILDGMQRCWEHILRDADAQCPDRPEDRRRTYQLPRHVCTGAPAEPAPRRSAREPGAYRMYVRQAAEMAGQSPNLAKNWPGRRRTCSRVYCTIWSLPTTAPRGPRVLWQAAATYARRYAAGNGMWRCGVLCHDVAAARRLNMPVDMATLGRGYLGEFMTSLKRVPRQTGWFYITESYAR